MIPEGFDKLVKKVETAEACFKAGTQVSNYTCLQVLVRRGTAVAITNSFRRMGYRVELQTNANEDHYIIVYYDKTN